MIRVDVCDSSIGSDIFPSAGYAASYKDSEGKIKQIMRAVRV